MKNLLKIRIAVILALVLKSGHSFSQDYKVDISKTSTNQGTSVYQPDSQSIAKSYVIPNWFRDGKFGIFIHWGVYSVPAYGSEWYARNMYDAKGKVYAYHTKTYGPVNKFGYKDFIPKFKGEKFNANEWAAVFKSSGATYVVPVAEHHDGFSMYNSSVNPWNAAKMGPKKDIIGELKTAITKQGLHFGLSSHRAENAWFYNYGMKTPSDVQDSTLTLYGEKLEEPEGEPMSPQYGRHEGSNPHSRDLWLKHTYELIDKYQPELMWFDWTVGKYPFQPTFYKYLAYYYNNAIDWKKEVVVNTKTGYSDDIQVFDIERGKSERIRKQPWQTDSSIGKKSWSYCVDEENKTPDHIIDDLIDIVSKNGNLLLNIGPKADGTITPEQKYVLQEIGKWLKINGEAIYATRPWAKSGEGSAKGTVGYMTDGTATKYTASDIRFTTKNSNLYALSLAWSDKDILIHSLAKDKTKNLVIKSVSMLGSKEVIKWKQTPQGLVVKFPKKRPSDYAHALKIELSGIIFGDAEIDKLKDKVKVGTYIFNHDNKESLVNFKCSIGESTQNTENMIPAHTSKFVSFDYINTNDVASQKTSMSIN
jgi:alpha-L-fucosidase